MPTQVVPALTSLPIPPDPNFPSTFAERAFAFTAAQRDVLQPQLVALANNVKFNADDASISAVAAANSALVNSDTVRLTPLTGISTAAATPLVAGHTVLQAFGFIQRQITDLRNTVNTSYSPATQFSPNLPGLWYDPSDYSSLTQDSAGATAVTAVTQPVGLMMDKRLGLGLELGTELVSNGKFDSNITGWVGYSANAAVSWVANKLRISASTSGVAYTENNPMFTAVVGRRYYISVNVSNLVGVSAYTIYTGTASGTGNQFVSGSKTSAEIVTGYFTAIGPNLVVLIETSGTAGRTMDVDDISIKPLESNHISQATASARPITATADSIQSLTFDGLDDGMATNTITLSANMDCFFAVRRNTGAGVALAFPADASSTYFGLAVSGSGFAADSGSGTPTYFTNGASLNGGAVGTTRGQLHTALTVNSWVVLEIRNLDLSGAAWSAFRIGNYSGFQLIGDFGGMILCPAGDAATRRNNRRFLGSKVGLTLS